MTTTTTAAPVLTISLERLEGADVDLVKRNARSFAEADAILAAWARTAPKGGGYDKCAVTVVWESGDRYETRYDLGHPSRAAATSLAGHVRTELAFWSGAEQPAHMTPARYLACVENVPAAKRAGMAEMLRDCAF